MDPILVVREMARIAAIPPTPGDTINDLCRSLGIHRDTAYGYRARFKDLYDQFLAAEVAARTHDAA